MPKNIKSQFLRPEKVWVWDQLIEIPPDDLKLYSGQFEILTEAKTAASAGSLDDFFKGANESWGAFREDWDFRRSIYTNDHHKREVVISRFQHGLLSSTQPKVLRGSLWKLVKTEMEKPHPEDNQIVLIQGGAGLGKTVLLKRLGYDTYSILRCPVIFVTNSQTLDYKRIDAFIKYLSDATLAAASSPRQKLGTKILILIDDAALAVRHLTHLRSYLTSRSRSALVVAAERKGEWEDSRIYSHLSIAPEYVFTISDKFTDAERTEFVGYVKKLGYQSLADEYLLSMLANTTLSES